MSDKSPFNDIKEDNLPRDPWGQEGITTFSKPLISQTQKLRERIAEKLYQQRWYEGQPTWENSLLKELFRNYAAQILQACKEAGLKFVEIYVATTSKDGILPDTHTEIKELEDVR